LGTKKLQSVAQKRCGAKHSHSELAIGKSSDHQKMQYCTKNAPGLYFAQCLEHLCADLDSSDAGTRFRFSNAQFIGEFDDAASDLLERTRAGHMEVIEMASIPQSSVTGRSLRPNADGTINCDIVRQSSNLDGTYGNAAVGTTAAQLINPEGDIGGTSSIVNVAKGTLLNYTPTALDDFRREAFYSHAGAEEPNLSNAGARSTIMRSNGPLSLTWGDQKVGANETIGQRIDAVSSVLMASNLSNDYSLEQSLSASTEWVVTMPTKRFYVDPRLTGSPSRVPPFRRGNFIGPPDFMNCTPTYSEAYDRNGEPFSAPVNRIEFGVPDVNQRLTENLCGSAATVGFVKLRPGNRDGSAQEVVGPSAMLGGMFGLWKQSAEAGFVLLSVMSVRDTTILAPNSMRRSSNGISFLGLPVIGFGAIRFENRNTAPGIQAFFDGAFNHRLVVFCEVGGVVSRTCGQ
jgi:hypothetical protein